MRTAVEWLRKGGTVKHSLIVALFSSVTACAADRMSVYVCNQGRIPSSVVAGAKREASLAFQHLAIEIVWRDCAKDAPPRLAGLERVFVIRLRPGMAPMAARALSLETMGRAYVPYQGGGYLADAYYRSIESMAEATSSRADIPELLGYVMTHELGHLLLGPGHSPGGVMRAVWRQREMQCIRSGGLKFDAKQIQRIRGALGATSDATDDDSRTAAGIGALDRLEALTLW